VIRATTAGWAWLVGFWNRIGLALAILAFVGIGTYTGFRPHHWWLVIVYLAAVLVLCFAEGAYRIWDEADRAAADRAAGERLGELRVARTRVVDRLKGMRTAKGQVWTDEKYILGGELDRLGEAIAQVEAGSEWSEVYTGTRQRVLLDGDRDAIDDCLARLEGLG
jgi:hypothetical protein